MAAQTIKADRLAEGQPNGRVPVGRAVVMLNLLLAVVVLAKDLLLAAYLGAGWQADAFFLAFFLPDAIGSNVLATVLATALVPSLVSLRSTAGQWQMLVRRYAIPTCLGSILLAAAVFWLRQPLLLLIADQQSTRTCSLAGTLLGLILPIMILYPLSAVASALLQAHQCFVLPALGPVVQNGMMLAALALLCRMDIPVDSGIFLTSAALPAAALCTLLLIGWGASSHLARHRPTPATAPEAAGQSSQRLLPWLIIAVSTQLLLLGERFWAGRLGEGVISALNYAYRLAQFPLWTFVSALAMVTLPILSVQAVGDDSQMSELAKESLLLALLLTIPTGLALSTLSRPIVTLLMKRGNFGPSSVLFTSQILAGYALSLTPAAIVLLGQRFFLAKGNLLIPAGSCLLVSVATFAADGWLVSILGPAGLGYGAALGAVCNAWLTLHLLQSVGLRLSGYLRAQAGRLLLGHLPFAATLLVCALTWPSIAERGRSAWLIWLVVSALLLPFCWLVGLSRTRLLQPVLTFLGVAPGTLRRRSRTARPVD